jgi:translocation and assembly module TamB
VAVLLKRLTLGTGIALGAALAIPLALLGWLAYTESGLRFIVDRVPERIGKLEGIRLEGVSGTIAGGFSLQRFELVQERVALRAAGVSGRLRMLPLLWQSIAPRDVRAASVHLTVRPATTPPRRPPRFLPRFLSVDVGPARIDELILVPMKGQPQVFRDIAASGLIRSTTLRIYDAQAGLNDLRLQASALLRAGEPLKLRGSARAEWIPDAPQPRWIASAEFDGDLDRIGFGGQLLEPFRADIRDGAVDATGDWSVRSKLWVRDFDLRDFGGSGFLGDVSGDVALEIDANGYRARGALLPAGLGAGKVALDFDGSFSQRVLNIRRLVLNHAASGTRIETGGEIEVGPEDGPRLGLTGNWKDFRWPLGDANPPVRSSTGRFAIEGTWPYRLQGAATVEPAGLPALRGTLRGTLAKDHLAIAQSEILALDGTARLAGEVRWAPAESWKVSGAVRGLNPGRIRADLPGSLDFQLAASGAGFAADAPIDVDVRRLTGRIRGTAARGSGRINLAGQAWRFRDVDFAAGGLRVALDGLLTPTAREFDFRLEASDLGVLAPGSRGRLQARGSLRGTPAVPIVKLTADGSGIEHLGVAVGRLDADVDFDPRPGRQSDVVVTLRELAAADRRASRAELRLKGASEAHDVDLVLDADVLDLRGEARGRFEGGRWAGTWNRVDLDLADEVRLGLDGELAMAASADSASAERFCLRSRDAARAPDARLCAAGRWAPSGWESRVDLARLPLAALPTGFEGRATLEGTFDLEAQASQQAGPILGTLRADLAGAKIRRRRASGREDIVDLGSGVLTLASTQNAIEGRLDLDAGPLGSIEGRLEATRASADTPLADLALDAELRAKTSALGIVNLYVPELDRASGALDMDLVVGGTLGAPLVNGVLRLRDGELDLYQVNLALRAATLEARLIDNGFTFKGSARAGDGSIEADGKLTWTAGEPSGQLRVKGQDLLVADVPEARITASPDLSFRVEGRDLDASGTVTIPYARLVPADLAGAVLTSSDEVLVGDEPVDPESTFRVTSNLKLVLGERVTIDALGLTGRLAGSISAQTLPDGSSRGSGELGVAEGKYAALGRRLDIERGRLIFSGGLLGDPGIDIRATKEFPDVKAGVNVRGTLREPRMTFFSEPSLPQSQIVSLILAGGTLESAQAASGSGNASRDALIAQGGAILAQQLGNRIGIEDVGIEQNLANETSLVLGKYLSPRLYVSYGISFAEAINTLKMRYTINDRWTLRTEAGKEQSAEIVYTIERN